jgi:hypothetical protein
MKSAIPETARRVLSLRMGERPPDIECLKYVEYAEADSQ